MSHVLLYSRTKSSEPVAEQTVCLIAEQLDQIGHHVDIAHTLNISRFILNNYDTVHFVVEDGPLTLNEVLHLGLCKTLQKNTLISLLNSDQKMKSHRWLQVISPDALSVSQTNHMKYYRWMTKQKFILPPLPRPDQLTKLSDFKHEAYLASLFENVEEALSVELSGTVYFDGRKLLQKQSAAKIRKKWNELIANKKISADYHLLLSDAKIEELLQAGHLTVLLAYAEFKPTEFCQKLGRALNKKNLVVINEYQSTGFSQHWTSGQNCVVVSGPNWLSRLENVIAEGRFQASHCRPHELYDAITNELSRLYAKLTQQKTTLLTSRSAKL